MKDYSKIAEITVHNQAELDEIPLDFRGRIYIQSNVKVIVSKHYYWSVVARGNSSVVARENVQVVNRLTRGRIKINGNAREVFMPKTIHEFMDFYGIKHDKTTAVFYKAVHKKEGRLFSDYMSDFEYIIGECKEEKNVDPDIREDCGRGIHISHLNWALSYGSDWVDIAIIEVESKIKDIVMPHNTDGKVRTSKVKVLREVPLSECGIYGKIIERRLRPCQTK